MNVRILTFGGLHALIDGSEEDALAAQRLRAAVLVYLAVERRASRDGIAALFWPESPESNARQSLRQILYNLRRAFGEDWLESTALELRCGPALESDAADFESAAGRGDFESAARLYAGPFLHAVHLLSQKSWEAWVDGKRAQYARTYRKVCRQWVDQRQEAGDLAGAIAAAQRWTAPDPFDDEAQHRLLQLLSLTGDRNAAIRQYEAYEKLLEAEGLAPLDETVALIEAVRTAASLPTDTTRAAAPEPDAETHPSHASQDRPDEPPAQPVPAAPDPPRPVWRRRRLASALAAAAFLVGAGTGLAVLAGRSGVLVGESDAPLADAALYVVFPLEGDAEVTPGFNETLALHDALSTWTGISLVPRGRVDEATGPRAGQALDPSGARAIARALGAGRFIIGAVERAGSQVLVYATPYDSNSGEELSGGETTSFLPDMAGPRTLDRLAAELLGMPTDEAGYPAGTNSVPAIRAFQHGRLAISRWELRNAEALFLEAARHDPEYGDAWLWLALSRSWSREPRSEARWAGDAERAWARRAQLSELDRRRASALRDQAQRDFGSACGQWRELVAANPDSFVELYSYATCLRADDRVVPDARSPTGHSFRSSYQEALRHWARALQQLPSIHASLGDDGFDPLLAWLYTRRGNLRQGVSAAPASAAFVAYPSIDADTLAFFAFPREEVAHGTVVPAASIENALRTQREQFLAIATGWAAAYPESAGAHEALAIAMQLLGFPAAIDTLRRARTLATAGEEALRVASSEVWMQVKLAVRDTAGLRSARILADSILASYGRTLVPTVRTATVLASLAALTGRAQDAAAYTRAAVAGDPPGILSESAPYLLALASLGGPAERLRTLENDVIRLRDRLDPGNAEGDTEQWLRLPAIMAMPEHVFRTLRADRGGTPLFRAVASFAQHDTTTARLRLDELEQIRRSRDLSPAEVSTDMMRAEASLRALLGDTLRAIADLELHLSGLFATPPRQFLFPGRAGSLVRAMALLAVLEEREGRGADAARWARAVAILWSDADPFLQPLVREMLRIAGSGTGR